MEKILKPVNRLVEGCVFKIKDEDFYTICSSDDNSVILYAKTKLESKVEEAENLNIISTKKLLSGLHCLEIDGKFELVRDTNSITCHVISDDKTKTFFKFHLADNNIIKECPVKIEKIANLKFDTTFVLGSDKVKQILAAASFATDASKVYFYAEDATINAKIDDETLQNIDKITIPVTKKWSGEELTESFPISMEVFKNLATIKSDVIVRINHEYKVFIFQTTDSDGLELKYIVSALIR